MSPSLVRLAVQKYEVDNGFYPATLDILLASNLIAGQMRGPYIISESIPRDEYGNPYGYYTSNNAAVLVYTGSDGRRYELDIKGRK